jgi:hypothetical protein
MVGMSENGSDCSVPSRSASFWAARTSASSWSCCALVALLVPLAEADQMLLEAIQRIAERPGLARTLWPVGGGIIGRGMSLDPVGEELDQGRPKIGRARSAAQRVTA